MSGERVELRADVGGSEPRSGVRLSRLRDGTRTWVLTLLAGDDPAGLAASIAALREIDAELERAYVRAGLQPPRVHQPLRHDDAGPAPAGRSTT